MFYSVEIMIGEEITKNQSRFSSKRSWFPFITQPDSRDVELITKTIHFASSGAVSPYKAHIVPYMCRETDECP